MDTQDGGCSDGGHGLTEGLIKTYMSFLSTLSKYSRWQNGHINRIYCSKDPQGHIITPTMDMNSLQFGGGKQNCKKTDKKCLTL